MRKTIGVVTSLVLLSGCGTTGGAGATTEHLGGKSESTAREGVDIWLASSCPSAPIAEDSVKAFGITDFLIGGVLDHLVDTAGTALANAAEADKNGQARAGQSPAFLFETPPKNSDGVPYLLPTCAVIALADSPPAAWCEKEPFKGTSALSDYLCGDADDNESGRLESLLRKPKGAPVRTGKKLPRFYAEVELHPSPDRTALLPRLRALYYPRGLHSSKKFSGNKPRDISIKVSGDSPSGSTSLSTIHVLLTGFVPTDRFITQDEQNTPLNNAKAALWIAVAGAPKKLPALEPGDRFMPVNLTGEIREIGDPNRFLQALAAAFTENKESLSEQLEKRLVPSAIEEAAKTEDQQKLANEVAYQAAIAKAYDSEAKLQAVCNSPDIGDASKSGAALRRAWATTSSAQAAVRKLELEYELTMSEKFGLDAQGTYDNGKTPEENCQAIGALY